MYMNRLRYDDFLNLFKSLGHQIIEVQSRKDRESRDLLRNGGLHLNERFTSKSEYVLATTEAWIISQKNNQQCSAPESRIPANRIKRNY